MTTKPTAARTLPPLPDPPLREPEDMTAFNHLTTPGSVHHLIHHFGNPETTLVTGEHYITPVRTGDLTGRRYPDLLIAFGVDPEAYRQNNAFIVSEQGKPPDFVLEIASRSSGGRDTIDKRRDYAAPGIPEYWRFDETGQFHTTRLAGDRLVNGHYEPIPIEEVEDGVLQGYSTALDLLVRWQHGQLKWHDPKTRQEIPTFEQEREGRLAEREGRVAEREGRIAAEEDQLAAEARVRELEAELERRDQEP